MKEYYTREEILNIIEVEIKNKKEYMKKYSDGEEVWHCLDAQICALASLYYKF